MLYILIKNGDVVVDKAVLAVELEQARSVVDQWRTSQPELTYVETDEATFNQTAMDIEEVPEDEEWLTAKAAGTASAIDFIARRLGLE